MLPVPAMPISPLLISAWVSSTRLWSVSNFMPIAMRLKISGCSLSLPASTMVPPLRPACHSVVAPFGGSRWASSVTRLAPETILKGATSTRRPESHSTFISPESIAIG